MEKLYEFSLPGEPIRVPANASRFFETREEAIAQNEGLFKFGWNRKDPYLHNLSFNSALVLYDDYYCTTDALHLKDSMESFSGIVELLDADIQIVEIGCGQGEFVDFLRERGFDAYGFDPVCDREEPYFVKDYWIPSSSSHDFQLNKTRVLFIMRCVLPHIAEPWRFVNSIFEAYPDAKILIEFQRLEWIFTNVCWQQVSHDHVNLFSKTDFVDRYNILSSHDFNGGEWESILFENASNKEVPEKEFPYAKQLDRLLLERTRLVNLPLTESKRLAIYGAAGKGIVFSHALGGKRVSYAIDRDPNRIGKFLENSGVPVISPESAKTLEPGTTILVMNPNHLSQVTHLYQGLFKVLLAPELIDES